ncbi:hypothetical protein HDU76_003000 [Blyttiomyces sp. JEL0837]|nr:hypothetical protein HDU76_003000 [Blyttiomyces sp. JEL0837]
MSDVEFMLPVQLDVLLTTPVVDHFLTAFTIFEKFLVRQVDPFVNTIYTDFLKDKVIPEPIYQAWSDILANGKSVFADRLPLMNPIHVLFITAAYLLIIFAGKMIMASLPKLTVKTLAMFHNVFLMTLSGYMCYGILAEAVARNYSLFGNPVDPTENGWNMTKLVWLFYVSKIFEFMDTVIMVLKKNNHQISFLHLYHHSSIFVIWWGVIYFAPGGDSYFSAALNSFIHVVMYGYYFFSSIGIKQVAFIKKYITMMQMTQFCCMLVQSVYVIYLNPKSENEYPRAIGHLLFWYMWSMLGLFGHFFINDRKKDKERREMYLKQKAQKVKLTF